MINTQAIKSKARRPGAALVALALAGTLGLLATQSAQAEDTTPTADTYTVTFLNGDGATTAFQRSATAGVVVPKPSLIQLELAGFTYPDNKYFENTWTYVSNGQEVDFANDTVDSDLTLAPILYDGVTISFSTGTGTTPAAVRAKKGATLGDVILPLASSVSRAGYIPRYWALPGQSTAAPFTYVLTSNLTLEMYWEPLDGVPYEIVYWVEKPNLGLNYSPRPGNASHYDYAYTETLGGSGYAGDLIGGPGIGADIEIKSIPAASFFDWEDPMHWAEWQFTEPTVLTGDGLTVVNVYCTLKTYRITFNIDPDGAGRTMTGDYDHDGEPETYGFASPYKLDYKFGDVVADRWPHPSMGWSFSDPGGLAYSYWIHPELAVSSGDWQTTRTDITAVMMPADANAAGYSLTLSWTDVTDSITMHYWGEQLPEQVSNPSLTRREYNGRTWVLLDDYTASIPPTTDFQSKAIPGFQAGTQGDFSDEVSTGSFPTAQDAQGKWHNYVNHYYRRLSNPFAYDNRGHGPAVASVSMQFGASLAALDAPMADQTGWHFKGWYADANGTLLYDFTGTMPSTDVTVFAKWESTDHQVTFLDHDGTALATDGSQQQGVQNGHTVNFTNLTIGGQRYVAWETNDAARGALVGWDYQPTPASPKQSFNADTAIYGDLTLYARWQTEGLVVAYHQPDGTLLEEDDGVGGQGYSNGVAAVVRDGTGVQCAGGTYFEGWRIDGTGAVYTPGSSFQVVGNPHFYPFCPELDSDLSDISYVASGKYVVSYLNGYGSVVLTQELDPGSVTAAPTDGELAAAGFSYAPDQLFEGEWTLSASPGAAFDFSTPINDHVILKPILYDSVTIYFETQGTPVDPLQVKKGVTLGSVTLPGFAAITRPGYDNPYWSLADPSQAVRDNVTAHAGNVLNDNLTLYTVWHAIPNGTEYHVVYWVERPNMGVQFTPTPGNPDHYMFGYAETAARMGTAGQTVGGPDDGADNVIGNLNGVVLTGPEDPLKWSQWQFTEKTTINGDGSTIVNVYARLKVYWFQFDLKTKAPSSGENTTLEYDADLDGVIDAAEVYTHYEANSKLAAEDIHALQVPYKFGEKLGKRWPHPDNGAVFHIDNVALPDFYYWKSPDNSLMAVASSGVWQTPRTEVTGAMMPVDPGQTEPLIIKAVTTNFVAYGYEQVKFRYWTQPTPEQAADSTLTRRTFHGQTWVMASAYSADIWFSWWVGAAFDFSPKALEGMTNVGRDWSATLTGPGDYEDSAEPVYDEDWVEMLTPYRNFYYARNPITLTYNMSGHGTQVPAATLAYGWSLASYDKFVADTEAASFRGWYADSNLTTPFDFSTTAGLVDITVYAKWESHDHKVTFVDADGSPLALDGSDEHGVENGGVFNFSGLTIAGLRFQAGLLNDAVRGAFVGWDYLPAGSTTKQAFPQDTKIYKDYTLYARWKTEGLYAYYHDANGTTIWVDKGVEDGGYTQGALLTVRDPVDDPVLDTGCLPGHDFIGWRVGGKGQVYQVASTLEMPGASAQLEVSGEPHLYAFCLSPIESSQLVTVRYASNTGSGTASGADVDGDGIDDRSFLMVRGNNVNTLTQAEAVGFTRTGYKLAGWKTVASDPDGEYPLYPLGGEYITGKGVQTLYAVWEELQAAITYEVANRDQGTVQLTGASGDGKALVHEAVGLITGQPVGAVATAAENYTFAGWYRDGILITTDPVLVPQRADEAEMWADAKYVAVFDTTIQVTFIILYPAGTETVVKAVAYGMPAAAPHITVPEGYTWLGWDKAFDRVTEDITVTGSFAVKQYTVRFVDHDGTLLSEQTVAHGANATAPPDPTWSGHVFSGWDRSFARVVKDLTVTALYDRTVYTVKFVDHDAKVLAEQKVPQGAEATAPDDPSWAGHKFLGWDKDFSNITSDLTVVALYDEVFYTVKFVDHDGKVLSSQQVVEGGAAKAPANPTWTGHTFSGWDKDFSNITGDLTVTALYDQVLHKVTFVDHDGTVLKVHQVPHGGAAAAPDEPTREGHEFAGWDKDFSVVTADLLVTALYRPLSDATDDPTGDPTDQPSGGQPGPTPTGGYSWTGTSLPFTGSNSTGLLLIGFGILLLGGTLRWVSLGRRRETRPPRP